MFPSDRDPDEGCGAAGNDDDGPRESLDAGLRTRPGTRRILVAAASHSDWMMRYARPRERSIE